MNNVNAYSKDLSVQSFAIEAGKLIAVLNEPDAKELGLLPLERVLVTNPKNKRNTICVVDVSKKKLIENTHIGLFQDVTAGLNVKQGDKVNVAPVGKPKSLEFIKKKIEGKELTKEELKAIVSDIDKNMLSDIEASAFMTAVFINGYTLNETVNMTKALTENGLRVHIEKEPVVDKHSIGGINGRATMLIVPIVAAAGLYMPKTSSRSITSSAGTADSMEVLCNVNLTGDQIKNITEKVGGVICWGGALDLAPVDDKIIKIEHPLSLDPEGQVIASVMAKKSSVSAKFLVIDIPVGPGMKIKDKEKGKRIANNFISVGKLLGLKVESVLTDGVQPSGPAFGPALETKNAMEILEGKVYNNLAQKACELAGVLMELSGKVEKGKGFKEAKEILSSGKALAKMKEIIAAQGGKIDSSDKIKIDSLTEKFKAVEEGEISFIDVKRLIEATRIAGCPNDINAGLLLNIEVGQKIKSEDLLFTVYSSNKRKLDLAKKFLEEHEVLKFERVILEKFI